MTDIDLGISPNDPFLPDPVNVAAGANATFDGTDAETDVAVISGAMATFDAEVHIDAWDGTEWQEVTQLADAEGNATFTANWHTQLNRLFAGTNRRRVRIENVGSASGFCAVEGDER